MSNDDFDTRVRLAAFDFLHGQTKLYGEVLPREFLEQGFLFEGHRVPLISPQGIFTPKILDLPLTFCTVPPTLRKQRPYDDRPAENGLILYRYRGTDPQHRDNVGLREAMHKNIPLIYLFGMIPGRYRPVWPVYIVGDNPAELTFTVAVDEIAVADHTPAATMGAETELRRKYVTVETQQRLHQAGFRERVLRVYKDRCSICRLHHRELLDAAHILSDKHPLGEPIIPNGLSLCKLHHAAYEQNLIGITPDYIIKIRKDLLREHDGPMLKHGIQDAQNQYLHVPRENEFKPKPEFLDIRYQEFRKAG